MKVKSKVNLTKAGVRVYSNGLLCDITEEEYNKNPNYFEVIEETKEKEAKKKEMKTKEVKKKKVKTKSL